VTGGLFDGAIRLRRTHPPNVVITAAPLVPLSPDVYERGIDLLVASIRQTWASPLARLKTIHRLEYLMAREEALENGADDALLLHDRGGIAECTSSNIFLFHDDRLSTPSLDCPILAGVTREVAIEAAHQCGFDVREGIISDGDLWSSSGIFVTATSTEILPVRAVNGRVVGGGARDRRIRQLHDVFRNIVRMETGTGVPPLSSP
jgi:branched-chain amino acid aminotransferase